MNTTHKTKHNSEIINTTNNQGAWRQMKITHANYFEKNENKIIQPWDSWSESKLLLQNTNFSLILQAPNRCNSICKNAI
jgi:hypothetical protein